MLNYRPEIDGLRAIAVIPVIFFHAGITLFSGGFVGVDIFFVISGYLITKNIIHDLNENKFSIITFYEKRSRRIFPALFFVVIITCIASWFILTPMHMKEFLQSMLASIAFVSNIFFKNQTGYFNTSAEFLPLLHTWSLAIEEQFYLIFPLVLIIAWFIAKHLIFHLLILLAFTSFSWSNWSSFYGDQTNSFYFLSSRVWELLIGSLSAILLTRSKRKYFMVIPVYVKQFFSLIGFLFIIISFFFFSSFTPHPSFYSLIPVIGTLFIILFASKQTLVGKFLSNKYFVTIGLISYSLYLWHHPIIVFNRYISLTLPSYTTIIGLILLTFLLSTFSYFFIELPFRNRDRLNYKKLVGFLGLAFLLICSFGMMGTMSTILLKDQKFPPNIEWMHIGKKISKEGEVCIKKPLKNYPYIKQCFFGDVSSNKTIGLFGDSHAQAISKSLNEEFKRHKIRGSYIEYNETCEVIYGSFPIPVGGYDRELCRKSFLDLKKFSKNKLNAIILLTRWTYRLYPIENLIDNLTFDNGVGGVEPTINSQGFAVYDKSNKLSFDKRDKKRILVKNIQELSKVAKLILIYPIPETGWNIFLENSNHYMRYKKVLKDLIFPSIKYDERNKFIIKIFDDISLKNNNVIPIKIRHLFCDSFIQKNCVAQYAGVPFYLDDDHLSDEGARMVINEIFDNYNISK